MKFDSNAAWQRASATVSANRDVLLALSGVFFLLPSLAFSLFFPQPEPSAGMDEKAILNLMADYYTSAAPFVVPMFLVQAAGTLAMLTLFTDHTRPTVGEAIRRGAAGILPYLLAQLVLGIALGVAGGMLLVLASLTGVAALTVIAATLVVLAAIYAAIRTSLVAPLIAVETMRNPIAALRRSWHLTDGNSGRLGLFYLLVIVAFVVIVSIAMAIIGIVLALVAGPDTARVISAVVSAGFGAVMSIYMVAILAAVHRQLAGPSARAIGDTFE